MFGPRYVVEVLQGYTKQFHQGALPKILDRLDRKRSSEHVPPTLPKPRFIHKVKQRLPAEALLQLTIDYQGGQSTRQLMATYGLGKGAVLRLLEAAGVQTRQQGLIPTDQVEAAKLYADGRSAAKVATKLGCSPDSVLSYARAAGIPIRPRQGGHRKQSA